MVYIKLENDLDIGKNKGIFFKKRMFYLKNKFTKLKEEKFEDNLLISLSNLENYTLEKLSKYIKLNCITRVVLSEILMDKEDFIKWLKSEGVEVCDGRWLLKNMAMNIVKYINILKKESINYQEISILSNDVDRTIKQIILDLAKEVRILNVVTNYENKFSRIEKELYTEKGIILNINNNYSKSLSRSDIILNFDFCEDELNKYNLNSKACIINFKENVKMINTKIFEGINVNSFDITIPRKYIKECMYFKDFNNTILYESLIYKITSPENIKREIKEDNVSIAFLKGINGIIRKNEYLKLSKKIAN